MFAVNTYEEIEKQERELSNHHIIVLLFVKPSNINAKDIIEEFDYIHYNSKDYCSIYAVGYTNDMVLAENDNTYSKITTVDNSEWFYSNKNFVEFKNNLESRLKWKYSGNAEMIILQSNPSGKNILNFQNYLSIDINHGLKKGYIDTFSKFMESLVRNSKNSTEVYGMSVRMKRDRIKLKEILINTIDDSKKVPTPIKKILKDNLFFFPAINTKLKSK